MSKTSFELSFNRVSGTIYGHYAYEVGQSILDVLLPGFINFSTPEQMDRMSRVQESAAEIVLAELKPHPLSPTDGEKLLLPDGELSEAFWLLFRKTKTTTAGDIDNFTELVALDHHRGYQGFAQTPGIALQENYTRIAKAAPIYGETA